MGAWLKRIWTDEEAFKGFIRATAKFAITSAGFFAPLLVDSKLAYYAGPILAAAGVSIPTRPLAPPKV